MTRRDRSDRAHRARGALAHVARAGLILIAVGPSARLRAQVTGPADAPPVVIRTVPEAGSIGVDPALSEVRVTFSKPMRDGRWSWVKGSEATFPEVGGPARIEGEGRVAVLPVRLRPGRDYLVWVNSERPRFEGFADRDGRPAVPYLLAFRTAGDRPAPTAEDLGRAFDALGDDMARDYSHFALKRVDWPALRAEFRPKAVASGSESAFLGVVSAMLARLEDGHVWIESGGRRMPTFLPPGRPANVNRRVRLDALDPSEEVGRFAAVGTTRDGRFGAIVLRDQSSGDEAAADRVAAFVAAHRDAPGFVVDPRTANGGDERLARTIARAFCREPTVYARSRVRSGPRPDDLSGPRDRTLPGSAEPYRGPVVCLIGPGSVSSGEGFAQMMACLPDVTLVGASTRGSTGNPAPFPLPGLDASVWYSRWLDLTPDGRPVEGHGIIPEVPVDAPPSAYRDGDPTWDRAMGLLRSAGDRPRP